MEEKKLTSEVEKRVLNALNEAGLNEDILNDGELSGVEGGGNFICSNQCKGY